MTLRLLLGDQLHIGHSWFKAAPNPDVCYTLMEILPETAYTTHHIQKVVGFFGAMRAFAAELEAAGHRVRYFTLDDPDNQQSFEANCRALIAELGATRFEYLLPDEYRVDQHLAAFAAGLHIPAQAFDTEHFLAPREAVQQQFSGKKTYLMEAFYRKIRAQYGILMEPDGKTPLQGQWNFDAENRKKLPKNIVVPPAPRYFRDVTGIVELLARMGVRTIGTIEARHFDWPLTRAEALDTLRQFVQLRLPQFGDYQDAMSGRDWLLFHSRLSFVLNIKLLRPLEVVEACVAHWQKKPDTVPFAALEGFVRQIIGWREYMRGIYWAKMPDYRNLNFFEHSAPLPEWFWTANTKMRCLQHSIGQSLERAYAHHIQRLMVTGNFALLLGVHPDEVDAWYLGIYMDALEWVEITNTRGMSQFADGGLVGTKPYVSSANYIHKMSDYCTGCAYNKDQRYGPDACPFNSLYWDFYDRHREKLVRNPRIGMMYKVWDAMAGEERAKILERAEWCRENVEKL